MIKINAAARLRASTLVKADWFDDLDKASQDKYLADHPHSSRAKGGLGGTYAARENTNLARDSLHKAANEFYKHHSKSSDLPKTPTVHMKNYKNKKDEFMGAAIAEDYEKEKQGSE